RREVGVHMWDPSQVPPHAPKVARDADDEADNDDEPKGAQLLEYLRVQIVRRLASTEQIGVHLGGRSKPVPEDRPSHARREIVPDRLRPTMRRLGTWHIGSVDRQEPVLL